MMSGLFKKRSSEPPVSEETREWMESYFQWLMASFGEENIKNRKILTPEYKDFPIRYNGQQQAAFDTLRIVAEQMEINPGDITLHIYKEGQSEIDTGSLFGNLLFLQSVKGEKYSGGLYYGKQENGKYLIGIEDKALKNPLLMVAVLAHELSHVKLLGENMVGVNKEYLTDMTTIIFGMGIFNANAAFQTLSGYYSRGWSSSGYLSQAEWGYALALFSYVREEENPEWSKFLSKNVKADFKKSMGFIRNNPEKIGKPKNKPSETGQKNDEIARIYTARKNKNFEELIAIYTEQLAEAPNNKTTHNNIGYYLLQQKKYAEAIPYFNTAIKIDPKWDFPYNNRGYCKLQLEDVQGSYKDIIKACEINPFNSFAWRNLGAYYLKTNEFEKALENFEEAERIDDTTELINFYLGRAYEKSGNKEKAQYYLNKSAELDEYIDLPDEQ